MVFRVTVRASAVGVVFGLLALASPTVVAAAGAAPADGPVAVAAVVNRSTATRVEAPTVEGPLSSVTLNVDALRDTVTLRERDTMKQERVKIEELKELLLARIS